MRAVNCSNCKYDAAKRYELLLAHYFPRLGMVIMSWHSLVPLALA